MAKARLADASTGGDSVKQRALTGRVDAARGPFATFPEQTTAIPSHHHNIRQYMSYKIEWCWGSVLRGKRRLRRPRRRVKSRQASKRKRLKIGFEAVKTFLSSPSAHLLNYSALENDLRKLMNLRHPPRKLRAVALHFGVYNFVRQHHSLGTTPAVAAGLEEKPWSLEKVVEMTEAYWLRKLEMA
jgi:hypothetical protein